jgi:hypothetical protein
MRGCTGRRREVGPPGGILLGETFPGTEEDSRRSDAQNMVKSGLGCTRRCLQGFSKGINQAESLGFRPVILRGAEGDRNGGAAGTRSGRMRARGRAMKMQGKREEQKMSMKRTADVFHLP